MAITYIGVRHHSPACARLVRETIRSLRPAFVLVEGPSDFNDRMGELFLGHRLPIALFSSSAGTASFSPFCDYSPEWAALVAGREVKARNLFIDLPAWHPAFGERSNRYADAELRYTEAMDRLGEAFRTSNSDALWDRLFEVESTEGLLERLTAYFELLRGESRASDGDEARERFMAQWVRAARAAAGEASIVVVTGGFHMPAIRALAAADAAEGHTPETGAADSDGVDAPGGWPAVPAPEPGVDGTVPSASSFLVPYSFRRLDAFTGYQSGMPSPEYYQRLWESGPDDAAAALTEAVVSRLRKRGQPVSTADLIAARTQSEGLAMLREHPATTRTDLLDGLVSALVSEDLDQPLPWSRRGALVPGAHPAVVEMVAALSGSRVGRLHPKTPAPPLVHDVTAELERLGLDHTGTVTLHLPAPGDLERSRTLHRLRVLRIPGYLRESGPAGGLDPVDAEEWTLRVEARRTAALIEAGAHGATLAEAAATVLEEGTAQADGVAALAVVLFDTVLCGLTGTADRLIGQIAAELTAAPGAHGADLGAFGDVLTIALGLWRHDRIYRLSHSPALARVIAASAGRVLWLAQSATGPDTAAEPSRLRALAALRDAVLHAESVLETDRGSVTEAASRLAAAGQAPPDLRGAALGLLWSLGETVDAVRALPGGIPPKLLGDWLSGLFALAREQAGGAEMVAVLDRLVTEMAEVEFLAALPALRMAFAYFPPREREAVAQQLLERRGLQGSARALLRGTVDPEDYRRARTIETNALASLAGTGLLSAEALAAVQGVAP
jgi:hypothetical protein